MASIFKNKSGEFNGEMDDVTKAGLDLGMLVEDLSFEDSDDVSLEGLRQELEECKSDDVVANILSQGTKSREYTKGIVKDVQQDELDSVQDYIKESNNLVSLHDQIRDCDSILSHMEYLLSGFQAETGSISSEIKSLQVKSMDMGLKLKNRKVAELKLARFVEDIILPPRMVDIIVDREEIIMASNMFLAGNWKFWIPRCYDPYNCSMQNNHTVEVVAKLTLNGIKVWKCLNTWGVQWGDNDHFYLKRGTGICGGAFGFNKTIVRMKLKGFTGVNIED